MHEMSRAVRALFALVPLCLLGSACAAPHYTAGLHYFGDVDPKRDREVAARANERQTDPRGIRVVQGRLPEGLQLTPDGNQILIAPGYEYRYAVLGTVSSEWDESSRSLLRSFFWYSELREDQKSRERFCKAQTPLRILTAGLWSYLSPLQYPCYVSAPDENDNTESHVTTLSRAAAAMGANLVVISGRTDMARVRADGEVIPTTKGIGIRGYAVVDRGPGEVPAQPVALRSSLNPR